MKQEKLDNLELDHGSLKTAFHSTQAQINNQGVELKGLKNQINFLNTTLEQKNSLLQQKDVALQKLHKAEYSSNQELISKNKRIQNLERLVMDLRGELEVERKMVIKYGNELNQLIDKKREIEDELETVHQQSRNNKLIRKEIQKYSSHLDSQTHQELAEEAERLDSLVHRDMQKERSRQKLQVLQERKALNRARSRKQGRSQQESKLEYESSYGLDHLAPSFHSKNLKKISPVEIPIPTSGSRYGHFDSSPFDSEPESSDRFHVNKASKVNMPQRRKRGTGGVKDALQFSGLNSPAYPSDRSGKTEDLLSSDRQNIVTKLPTDESIIAKNKSSSNILTWGNPYSSPHTLKDTPGNSQESTPFENAFQKKKYVQFQNQNQKSLRKSKDFQSRKHALDEAIMTSNRKRFQAIHNTENMNPNPNHYSVPPSENPLTYNTQGYPQKPVKTAGRYIPKKKKISKPSCVLTENEMTPSDIKIRDLKEDLLNMQVERDMVRDRLNKLALKVNQSAKSKMKKRDLEGELEGLQNEIMKVRLELRNIGGIK